MKASIKTDGLLSIQYLRAVAAIMVVIFHTCYCVSFMSPLLEVTYWMRSGVDIFFVISGYVMVISTANKDIRPLQFFNRRIVRIVPIYWIATAAMINAGQTSGWWQTLTSLFFIPHIDPDSGLMQPIVQPGWTLNYEMFFYAIFAVGLLLRESQRLAFMASVLGTLVIFGLIFVPTGTIGFYTYPILLEFLFGMAIAHFKIRGHWLLLPLGMIVLSFTGDPGIWRTVIYGVPAAAIVIGALSLEERLPNWKTLRLLGDASYSIYLFHMMILSALTAFWRKAGIGNEWFLPVVLTAQIGAGCVIHLTIEKPMSALLNSSAWKLRSAMFRKASSG